MALKVDDIKDLQPIIDGLENLGYVIEEELATVVFLALKIRKPILIEGLLCHQL